MAGYGVIFAAGACAVDFHFAVTPVHSSQEIFDRGRIQVVSLTITYSNEQFLLSLHANVFVEFRAFTIPPQGKLAVLSSYCI